MCTMNFSVLMKSVCRLSACPANHSFNNFLGTSQLYRPIVRELNNNTASITKIHRPTYTRLYPTVLVYPSGASVNLRYHEPRQIIRLPLNLKKFSEAKRALILEKRNPKKKVQYVAEQKDNFKSSKYLDIMKKGRK